MHHSFSHYQLQRATKTDICSSQRQLNEGHWTRIVDKWMYTYHSILSVQYTGSIQLFTTPDKYLIFIGFFVLEIGYILQKAVKIKEEQDLTI